MQNKQYFHCRFYGQNSFHILPTSYQSAIKMNYILFSVLVSQLKLYISTTKFY